MSGRSLAIAVMLALTGVLVTFSVTAPADANSAAPDLVIESLTVSDSSPQPGESIRLVATVRNRGDVGSPTTRLRYYRSTDSSISPLDVRVDENSVSILGPSDSAFDGTSVQAPAGAGRYYYTACVDSVTGESNTQNNCSARAPIDVASASPARSDISVTDAQIEHTCFTAVRSKDGSGEAEKGSPALLERFLLVSEVENLTGSPLEEVFVEFEVVHPNRGNSAKHESERVNIEQNTTKIIDPKKGFVVPFPNGTWIGRCTVKRDRPWPNRDVVLGTKSISFALGTYPPPHINPNIARGTLESCTPGHSSSYEVGSQIVVRADPYADLSESVRYNAHYVGKIYKKGERVWKGERSDNVAIILEQDLGKFTPLSPGEYTLDCLMYIEHRYDYEPIQQFLTSAMPCMKSLGLASICTVLVINVDAALGIFDQRRLIWTISNIFYVTPSGQVEPGAPDLEVDEPSVSHSSREVGETFTLRATVRNSGDSESSASNVSYYRSGDATITTDDNEVGTSSFVDSLDPQGSSPESTIVTVTGTTGHYYYGACVGLESDETDATNNCSAGVRVSITEASLRVPDTVVVSPSVSKSNLRTGESFRLRASVRNTGNGRSAATTLRYYRSTDSTITRSDTEVGTDYVNSQAPFDTDGEQVELTAPSQVGTYYYGACADTVSGESNTNNNCSDGVLATVSQGSDSGPDLLVDSISVRDTKVEPGSPVRLSVTVANVGIGSSPTFALRYYRSADSTISSSDTLEGHDQVPQRNSGQTSRETISLTAPSSLGTYYYGACIPDIPNESNIQNNCSDGVRVEVKHLYPDLVVESMSVSESTLQAGQRLRLEATVRNNGDEESAGTWLRYYRSTDSTISTSDTEFGAADWVGSLDPSESGEESISTRTPDDVGTYYYGACVDSVSDESDNNNCSSGVTVTVTVPGQNAPDLVVHSPSVYDKVFDPGERFQMSFWVRNQGDVGTTTNATLRYYRSTDSTISTADTELTIRSGVIGVGPIDASGSSLVTVYLNAHSSGTYYYGACVGAVLVESNTQNNCSAVFRVALTGPDLVVHPPSLSNASAEPGDSFTLSATVNNQGDSEAASTMLRYYRSDDSTISTSDTQVGTDSVSSLGPNDSSRESIDLTAPSDAGTSYYGACVDPVAGESSTQNNCSSSVGVGVGVPDRAALVAFYNATGGANWGNNRKWLSSAPIGEWSGVTTDSDGRVTHLNLAYNQLTGAIPAELGNLTNLEWLHLYNNQLTGAIPAELGNLTNLKWLHLSSNQLTGAIPAELGSLTNVEVLALGGNQLTGEISAELGDLANLEYLFLNSNQLTGAIPAELGNLANLPTLWLHNNQLTGEIPAELGNLANLQTLYLHNNQLTGAIPAELGNLTNLEWLHLSNNQLTGEIPAELEDLANLRWLFLNDNQLTGEIPAELGDLANLGWLYLNNNQLTGEIPAELEDLANLRWLFLNDNQLTGCIPEGLRNVANNDFSSLGLPFCMPSASAGDAASDRAALVAFYNATGGANWSNNRKWLSNAPMGEWHGVTTDSDGRVTHLDLYRNQLTGAIPAELGNLTNLELLSLYDNQLTGEIPAELGNLTNLEVLALYDNQLTGEIPAELGSLTNVELLGLGGNRLTGEIPAELGSLTNLTHLYLYRNQLTGEIPAELGSLTSLRRLDLYSNRLTGSIPAELGSLTNLTHLYLYRNQLTGEIPAELGELTNLERLYLRSNQLVGCIPSELRNIPRNDFGQLGLAFCGS